MFVRGRKRYRGIKMVSSLPLLSCESSVLAKENPDRKKNIENTILALMFETK